VRANGVAAEYKVFPDEGHGFTKRANKIDASNTFVVFLDKYLKAGAE
jgi:dipeptidyl aminopeptidase/acylaminoacyl peptidase